MAFLVDSGNPWEKETPALCVTSAVHKSERPDKDLTLFLVEKFAEVIRKTKGLYKVEVVPFGEYIFTLYTYGEPLERNKEKTVNEGSNSEVV